MGASRELLGVHPSSLIGENASIAPGARIGPFCVVSDDAVIGPNCELGAGVHILGATTLGADCVVRSHAVVGSPFEPGTTVLGHGNVVGAHAVVGATCTDKKHAPALASHLVIGDGNDIREHAQIHRSSGPDTVTKIGSGCLLMGRALGPDCAVGGGASSASNNALLAGHVVVGDHAVLGGAVAISQRNGVGAHAFVAGGARVDGWVPACARAARGRAEIAASTSSACGAPGTPARGSSRPCGWPQRCGARRRRRRRVPPRASRHSERRSAACTPACAPGRAGTRAPGGEGARGGGAPREETDEGDGKEKGVGAAARVPRRTHAPRRAATLTEPGRTLLPWRAIPRGEASSRARARARAAPATGRRTSTDGAAPAPPAEADAASTSPAPPPPRLERTSPESLPEPEKLKRLNMASLKALLQVRGLPTDGMKYLLVARLDQNRGAPLHADSNAAAAAAEAADVAWRVRDPSRAPDCQCGVPCKEKTVRKEGPNKGKTFWACRRPPKQAAPCGFSSGERGCGSRWPPRACATSCGGDVVGAAGGGADGGRQGGSDMFEDLVIMSSRPRARDAAAA